MVLKELTFYSVLYRGCGGNERTDYLLQFCIWEALVVLTEPIFHNFNARRV